MERRGFRSRESLEGGETHPSFLIGAQALSEHLNVNHPLLYAFVSNTAAVPVSFSYLIALSSMLF